MGLKREENKKQIFLTVTAPERNQKKREDPGERQGWRGWK